MTTAAGRAGATIAARQERIERALRMRVARIFRRQRRAFPALRVAAEALTLRPSELREAVRLSADADPIVSAVLGAWPDEEEAISDAIAQQRTRASQVSGNATLARIGLGDSWSMAPAVAQRIAEVALERAQGIEATSVARIRELLARGVENGDTAATIARRLRGEFDGWARTSARGNLTDQERAVVRRADMIARTEVADAWESTAHDVLKSNGWEAREWLTAGDERVDAGGVSGPCIENEAAGAVRIDEAFPSGDMWPPAHPLCRCSTAPAVLASG